MPGWRLCLHVLGEEALWAVWGGHKDNYGLCPRAKPNCCILVGGLPSCNPQLDAGTQHGSKLFHLCLQPQHGIAVWHF